jgi:hypothetical protein
LLNERSQLDRGGEVIKGTLDLLALKVLQLGPRELTAAGREALREERVQWERSSRGVNLVLRTAGE